MASITFLLHDLSTTRVYSEASYHWFGGHLQVLLFFILNVCVFAAILSPRPAEQRQ